MLDGTESLRRSGPAGSARRPPSGTGIRGSRGRPPLRPTRSIAALTPATPQVPGDGLVEPDQPGAQLPRPLVLALREQIIQLHAGFRHDVRERKDPACGAQMERRIEEVDRAGQDGEILLGIRASARNRAGSGGGGVLHPDDIRVPGKLDHGLRRDLHARRRTAGRCTAARARRPPRRSARSSARSAGPSICLAK